MEVSNQTLEEVRTFFAKDLYAKQSDFYIEAIDDHYAKISCRLSDKHKNAVGGVMGGVYFTMADFTMAVASNWQEPGTVSLDASISFVGVPKSDTLVSESELVKDGRSTCCYLIHITDAEGHPVAEAKFTGFHKR